MCVKHPKTKNSYGRPHEKKEGDSISKSLEIYVQFLLVCSFVSMLGIEPRTLSLLVKHLISELNL